MPSLILPSAFPYPGLNVAIADGDTMYDGRDGHYLSVGLSAMHCIMAALNGRIPRRILDMSSGFGRVTRVLRAQYPDAAITVCDLDRPGVDFAAAQFGARPAYSVEELHTLALGETFDLVWVGSLLTHLHERQTRGFLRAMARHMAPGATLLASVHGPSIAGGLRDWGYGLEPRAVAGLLDDYRTSGYGHRGYDASDGYGISISDRLWWETATAGGAFHLTSYLPQAWDNHQDIVVLHRTRHFARSIARARGRLTRRVLSSSVALAARLESSSYDACLTYFDPAFYLQSNPDVARAVTEGHYNPAFQHYWRRGRFEARPPHDGA